MWHDDGGGGGGDVGRRRPGPFVEPWAKVRTSTTCRSHHRHRRHRRRVEATRSGAPSTGMRLRPALPRSSGDVTPPHAEQPRMVAAAATAAVAHHSILFAYRDAGERSGGERSDDEVEDEDET